MDTAGYAESETNKMETIYELTLNLFETTIKVNSDINYINKNYRILNQKLTKIFNVSIKTIHDSIKLLTKEDYEIINLFSLYPSP